MIGESSRFRFKRGAVEFELVGSADDVRKAWDLLCPVVADALKGPTDLAFDDESNANEDSVKKKTPRKRARKAASAGAGDAGTRTDVQAKLMETELDGFPEIGDSPTALFAGYGLLEWAKESLGIDGLTAAEIANFYRGRFGIPNTAAAYRIAFGRKPRNVVKSGTPAEFRLMKDGRVALKRYVDQVAGGATAAEASTAVEKDESS